MLALALLGFLLELDPYLNHTGYGLRNLGFAVSLVAVAAVGLAASHPLLSLGLTWLVLLAVVILGIPPQAALVMTVVIGFACAAWGSRWTLWLSGLSIPVATVAVLLALDPGVLARVAGDFGLQAYAYDLYSSLDWQLLALALAQLALWVPFLAGLAWRFRNRSQRAVEETAVAEAQRDQAAEVAQVREQQAQLARDVHDVVGHSLTVILAQAQAAQFLQDETKVRASLETIATTAQTSLEEVRRVLSATAGTPTAPPATEELHTMLDGVRASGRQVEFVEEGQRRPLPPELATVAHRVLQEMVTNAVRHGVEGEPIHVERHWGWDLRLEVSNAVRATDETQPIGLPGGTPGHAGRAGRPPGAADSGGQGILGMRRRLESVGGRLDVRLRGPRPGAEGAAPTHTVTAWIPLPGTTEVRRG